MYSPRHLATLPDWGLMMTQTVYVRFSYANRVSEEVPIHTSIDLSKNSNRKRLLNRLIKQSPNITEITLLWISTLLTTFLLITVLDW
jgi:hypothetical protein